MELIDYLNCRVHITLNNGFYFEGLCLSADENSITIKDKTGRRVSLKKEAIETISEVLR